MKNKSFILSILMILIGTLVPLKSVALLSGNILALPIDKIAHFLLFFYLGINITRSIESKTLKFIAVILGISLGIITELLQQFIPGRNLEAMDGVMDTLGIIIGCLIYPRLKFMRENIRL